MSTLMTITISATAFLLADQTVWPGAEGAQQMNVQHELDWPRFIAMFIERVQRPVVD